MVDYRPTSVLLHKHLLHEWMTVKTKQVMRRIIQEQLWLRLDTTATIICLLFVFQKNSKVTRKVTIDLRY